MSRLLNTAAAVTLSSTMFLAGCQQDSQNKVQAGENAGELPAADCIQSGKQI